MWIQSVVKWGFIYRPIKMATSKFFWASMNYSYIEFSLLDIYRSNELFYQITQVSKVNSLKILLL